jgi:hypothetical protein
MANVGRYDTHKTAMDTSSGVIAIYNTQSQLFASIVATNQENDTIIDLFCGCG